MEVEKQTSRKRKSKIVRESDIIAAAYDIFSDKGYEKTAMSEVAKQAGVAEGTIYKYFKNKQDLLSHVISQFYTKLIDRTESSLLGVLGFENQLRVIITHHIHTFFQDLGLCRLLLHEVRPLSSYPKSQVHELTKRYSDIFLRVIKQAITNQEIKNDISPQTVRDMVFGGLEHAGWNVLAQNKSTINPDQLTNEMVTITLNGLTRLAPASDNFADNLDRFERLVSRFEKESSREA